MPEITHTRRELLGRFGTASTIAIGVAVAGCTGGGDGDSDGGGGDSGDGGNTVGMGTAEFQPDSLTVQTGTTVTWENTSDVGHTVTAYDDGIPEGASYFASGGFDSEDSARDGYPDEGVLESGDTYEHTFDTAGTYEYFCVPHEGQGMTGTITVE